MPRYSHPVTLLMYVTRQGIEWSGLLNGEARMGGFCSSWSEMFAMLNPENNTHVVVRSAAMTSRTSPSFDNGCQ